MPNRWAALVLSTGPISNGGFWYRIARAPCHCEETNRAWDAGPWCWRWFRQALSQPCCIRAPVVLGVVSFSVVLPSAVAGIVPALLPHASPGHSIGAAAQPAHAPDAASRRQDRGDFERWNQQERLLDLSVRRG
jgi:hypothetical protein